MRFGIITPVFDGCLGSLELLFREIRHQTYRNWIWMLCSNGYSEKISKFVDKKNYFLNASPRNATPESSPSLRPKMIYLNIEYEEVNDVFSLLSNVGKRRDYCIQKLETDYVLLVDADAKIFDLKMFEIINSELEAAPHDICIYKIKSNKKRNLPIFPLGYGTIDTLNYCISTKLAKKVGFPTTYDIYQKHGNDFWFFKRCFDAVNGDCIFIDRLFGQHNGNKTYLNLQVLLQKRKMTYKKKNILRRSLRFLKSRLLRSSKVLIYRHLLNPFDL
jgi:hypothetical protein